MNLFRWFRGLFRGQPIEQWSDEKVLDCWAEYSATKDWWAVDILTHELKRRGLA